MTMTMTILLSSCEWELLSHGSRACRGALETLPRRMHYKSEREDMTLVDDVRGKYDDKWRTRDMFALSSVARGDGWVRTESTEPIRIRHPKSANSDDFGWVLLFIECEYAHTVQHSGTVYECLYYSYSNDKPTLRPTPLRHDAEDPWKLPYAMGGPNNQQSWSPYSFHERLSSIRNTTSDGSSRHIDVS